MTSLILLINHRLMPGVGGGCIEKWFRIFVSGTSLAVAVGQHEYEDGHCCPTSEIIEDIYSSDSANNDRDALDERNRIPLGGLLEDGLEMNEHH